MAPPRIKVHWKKNFLMYTKLNLVNVKVVLLTLEDFKLYENSKKISSFLNNLLPCKKSTFRLVGSKGY